MRLGNHLSMRSPLHRDLYVAGCNTNAAGRLWAGLRGGRFPQGALTSSARGPTGQQQLVKAETVYMTSIFRRSHLVNRQVLHFEACPNRGCRGACYKLLAGCFTAQTDEPCCVELSRSRCLEHQLASNPLLSDN